MPPRSLYFANPFVMNPDIPDIYFCDRETETAWLIGTIINGNNAVLTAERRMGKSSLLKHVLRQKEITNDFNTLYVDIFKTKNIKDFVEVFSDALLKSDYARTEQAYKRLASAIPEIKFYAKLQAGPISTGLETSIKNEYRNTLDKIFQFLGKTKRQNLIIIDEFQTIEEYAGEKMAETLRTYMQATPNTHFIFSGSKTHMLLSMFKKKNRPFYESARVKELKMIPKITYTEFCKRLFNARKKNITDDAVDMAYSLFQGNTFEMQQIMNQVFSYTAPNKTADRESVRFAVCSFIDENDSHYRSLFTMENERKERTEKEKNLLRCIGIEGLSSELMSNEKISNYKLGSASSIQNTLEKLTNGDNPVLTKIGNKSYRITDKMFELWIAEKNGILQTKIDSAKERFNKENTLKNENPMDILPKLSPQFTP